MNHGAQFHFYDFCFTYPEYWKNEQDGSILDDFIRVVQSCFPEAIHEQIEFLPGPAGAILSLQRQGLNSTTGTTMIFDVGGRSTDKVAGVGDPETGRLRYSGHYGEPFGGGLFDAELAKVPTSPEWIRAATGEELEGWISYEQRGVQLESASPLDPPGAVLANPSEQAVDLLWDPSSTVRSAVIKSNGENRMGNGRLLLFRTAHAGGLTDRQMGCSWYSACVPAEGNNTRIGRRSRPARPAR